VDILDAPPPAERRDANFVIGSIALVITASDSATVHKVIAKVKESFLGRGGPEPEIDIAEDEPPRLTYPTACPPGAERGGNTL
jgi:hypothetical protein